MFERRDKSIEDEIRRIREAEAGWVDGVRAARGPERRIAPRMWSDRRQAWVEVVPSEVVVERFERYVDTFEGGECS